MANEYIDRMRGETNRPPYTPEVFKICLSQFEAELTPKFIHVAEIISESGEADIILALSELGKRLRVMGECLQPRAATHNIGNLLSSIDIARGWPTGSALESAEIQNINELGYSIVHSPDNIREEMESHRLITHRGERLIKKIDRESAYYRLPIIDVEMLGTRE